VNRLYATLALRIRRGMGLRIGDRRVPGHPQATGTEFEAYAAYAPGDDLRHLDWNALARLDLLVTRRFAAEREVCVHFLVDRSASMACPALDRKVTVADELVLALAWIALAGNDAVRVTLLPGDRAPEPSRVWRQRASARAVAAWLARAPAGGALDLGAAIAAHARCERRPAATVVVSDFMVEPAALAPGLAALRAGRHAVALLQVLGARERDPGAVGRCELRDVETGATHPVAVTPAVRARYRTLVAAHEAALRALATAHEAVFARLATNRPVPAFVAGDLAAAGFVSRR